MFDLHLQLFEPQPGSNAMAQGGGDDGDGRFLVFYDV